MLSGRRYREQVRQAVDGGGACVGQHEAPHQPVPLHERDHELQAVRHLHVGGHDTPHPLGHRRRVEPGGGSQTNE